MIKNSALAFSVEDRLKLESLRRIQNGVLFQLLVNAILWYYFQKIDTNSPYFFYGLALNTVLIGTRGLVSLTFDKYPEKLLKYFKLQLYLSLANAVAYGYLFLNTVEHQHIFTQELIILLFVLTGLMTGVIHSLAPTPVYQRTYIILMSVPIFIAFFNPSLDQMFHDFGMFFSIYVFYLLYSSRGVSREIKNSYQAENIALEKKQILQKVVNFIPGFVALADEKGNWVTYSESFEPFKKSKKITNLVHYYQAQDTRSVLTRELEWTENSQTHAYIVSLQQYEDKSLIIVGVYAAELVSIRHELDSQRSKAEFAARLATLGEMAGGIAHEINNPLAVIIGSCDQMHRLLNKTDAPFDLVKLHEKIERISKTSFRISKIVTGLRAFSRQADQDPFQETPLQQLVEETLELCKEKFYQNNVQLIVGPIPDVNIPIRSVQISQVLINLLNNAFDAVHQLSDKTVQIQFEQTAENIFLRVSDSGPGIPQDNIKKIFDPFFTTKEVGQGTGLGLSISRGILLDHQGELTLLTQQSMTTFQIRLPLQRKKTDINQSA